MCGRFVRSSPISAIASEFHVEEPSLEIEASYNVAPTHEIVIINNRGVKQILKCRWGFLPSWAKDESIGSRMINARAETVATKPSFKTAFRNQRCLIIADGFYEWQEVNKRKRPVYIHLKSGKPFGFAGLFNLWTSPEGEKVCTCTIITTVANELLDPVHDRMPVIIPKDKEDLWLDPDTEDVEALLRMLEPYPSKEMTFHQVSTRVNSPVYNSPEAIRSSDG